MTIIEIVVAVAIMTLIGVIGITALNPAGQLASARNNRRTTDLQIIWNGIKSNISDSRTGIFNCTSGDIPTSTKKMAVGVGNYDIAGCLLANHYLDAIPRDPSASSSYYNSESDYNTAYNVVKNASSGIVTVSAPNAESGKSIHWP